MLNTLSSRATFYDVIGYLVPGGIALGVGWLWLLMIDYDSAIWGMQLIARYGFRAVLCIVAVGYVAGHFVNAMSSLLLEKFLFKKRFAKAKQWYERVVAKCPAKAKLIAENVRQEFKLDVTALSAFDMRIRMEESMPNATVTGFSFLSFYGMSRTMALLSWLGALPIAMFVAGKYCRAQAFLAGGTSFGIVCAVGIFFCYQYLRFVEYYYDFLGSTLLRVDNRKYVENAKAKSDDNK